MNERLKLIRKSVKLSQELFGNRLGVDKATISRLEKGVNNITNQMIKSICREFNVNEEWLRYGADKMFIEDDSTIITELSKKYDLDMFDRKIIESYLNLSTENRKVIKDYMHSVANIFDETASAKEVDPIEKEVEAYRLELEAEKRGQISSASEDVGEDVS